MPERERSSGTLTLFEGGTAAAEPAQEARTAGPSRRESLFELDEALCVLMDEAVDAAAANDGEIPESLQQALVDYCQAFGEKVDNIARYIRSQEFEADNAGEEIERLSARKASAKNRAARLKDMLKYFMQSRGVRSLKGRLNTISLRKNSQDSLIIDEDVSFPTQYCRITVVLSGPEWEELLSSLPPHYSLRARLQSGNSIRCEPDEASIRSALCGGAVLEGAELRRGQHIRLT